MSGKCDFCSQADPPWLEEARDQQVALDGMTHGEPFPTGETGLSIGDWASCNACHRLIGGGQRQQLVRRAAVAQLRVNADAIAAVRHGSMTYADLVATVAKMHAAFWAARTGSSRHV